MDPDKVRDPRTYAIIGAAMEVHSALGCGFLEAVYQQALAIEFQHRGIPFREQLPIVVKYKGVELSAPYRADFVCFGNVIVELKAQASTGRPEEAQVVHYLKASGNQVGLLLNFGAWSLEHQRIIFREGWRRSQAAEDSRKTSEESEKSEETLRAS